jgi:hypothetical protein
VAPVKSDKGILKALCFCWSLFINPITSLSMEYKDFNFKMMGDTWKVKFVDNILLEEGESIASFYWGQTHTDTKEIYISKKYQNGKNIPSREIGITLLHELVHAIFSTGCYHASNTDEPLVEFTARCLKDILKSETFIGYAQK